MSLTFRCPACGNTIQVADEHAGLGVQCPVCQHPFTAPRPGETFATPLNTRMSPPTEMGLRPELHEGERKGLAVASLVLGVVGLCVVCLSPFAIVFGIIALVKASSRPEEYGGKGLAVAGLIVSVVSMAIWLMAIPILLPSLARARELAKRTTCAANMAGMGRGLLVYAGDGNQGYPVAAHWEEKTRTATGQVNYVGRIGSKRGKAGDPGLGETTAVDGPDGRELSTTRNLWILVRSGGSTPASFVCPSSDDTQNEENNPQDYWDFGVGDATTAAALAPGLNAQAYKQCSYGYQVPYGRLGRPGASNDPRMVLAADKGGFSLPAESTGPTPPPLSGMASQLNGGPNAWRPFNSANHGGGGDGEGQNVLRLDGSVNWANTPLAGIDNDNIYTQWFRTSPDAAGRGCGNAPTIDQPNLTPQGDTDALIYP